MDIYASITTCFSKYVTFRGRAQRSEYWWFVLFVFLLNIVATVLDIVLFGSPEGMGLLSAVVALATLLPSISVAVRRLHDIDRTGWWWWIIFVPLIGLIVLIVFFVTKGTEGDNRFGPDPLAQRA